MTQRSGWLAAGLAVALTGVGCGGQEAGGDLQAQRVVLEREVEGLRELAGRLDRGEPIVSLRDVLVGISEATVQDMLAPQLPILAEASGFAVAMNEAQLRFWGAPGITLQGTIHPMDHPELVGEVKAIGTLDDIDVDPVSGTLRARVIVDHLELVRIAGLEHLVTSGTTDELARSLRHAFEGRIPRIQIPVRLEQSIDFPSLSEGPVRLQGARMPLAVGVSDVFAGRGMLWIGIRVEPGEIVKQGPAPSGLARSEVTLDATGGDVASRERGGRAPRGPGEGR